MLGEKIAKHKRNSQEEGGDLRIFKETCVGGHFIGIDFDCVEKPSKVGYKLRVKNTKKNASQNIHIALPRKRLRCFLGESDGARSTGVTAQGSDGADREI